MTGSLHVGLAALGAAIGVGLIGHGRSTAVGRNPGASTKMMVQAILAIAFAEAIVFYALFLVRSTDRARMEPAHDVACSRRREGGEIEDDRRTFGVDWPHLLAQIISFGIVCAVLYRLAYEPVLKMLEARRAADRARPGQRREDQGGAGQHRGAAPGRARARPTPRASS